MSELSKHLTTRFPILTDLSISVLGNETIGAIPPFMGLPLSALNAPTKSACAFVLPRKEQVGRLAAILFALNQTQKEFATLCSSITEPCAIGRSVRIHPANNVFTFLGVYERDPRFFWLGCADGGKRTFPRAQAFRLQPTVRKRPQGRLDTTLLQVDKPAIDLLLDLESFGNLSFVPNYVLVLDIQSQFRDFADKTALHRSRNAQTKSTVFDLHMIGTINEDGSLQTDDQSSAGSPLVAVTSSIESLLAACNSTTARTVIINDLSLLKSVQHYDAISANHRILVVAEHSEMELVRELQKRQCKAWPLGHKEILIDNQEGPTNNGHAGPFAAIISSCAHTDGDLQTIPCHMGEIEEIGRSLEALNASLKHAENDALKALTGKLFGLLSYISGFLASPTSAELQEMRLKVKQLRADLLHREAWIGASDAAHIKSALQVFETLTDDGTSIGTAKGQLFKATLLELKSHDVTKIGVLARGEQHFGAIRRIAGEAGVEVVAFTAKPALMPEEFFNAIVCVGWPGAEAFRNFFHRYMAPDIKVLGYPHEARWLGQSRQKIRRDSACTSMTRAEKSALLQINGEGDAALEETQTELQQPFPADPIGFSIHDLELRVAQTRRGTGTSTNFEEKILAKYVDFVGGRFAYITEGHKLPIATVLLRNPSAAARTLPEKDVTQWQTGDYIVFPESGEREVIQVIADNLIGPKAEPLRKLARRWKDALADCGQPPAQIHAKLAELGCRKTLATVRNWVSNNSQIGPETKRDLELVAQISNSSALGESIEDVWDAIESIWSYHQSAGSVLKRILVQELPKVIKEVQEGGTQVTIDELGSAWVVQVERIEKEFESCSRSLVNRLRREDPMHELLATLLV
jgi:hypothetical protein